MLIQKDYERCCVIEIIWISLDFYYCIGNTVLRKSKCLEKFKPEISAMLCIFKKQRENSAPQAFWYFFLFNDMENVRHTIKPRFTYCFDRGFYNKTHVILVLHSCLCEAF